MLAAPTHDRLVRSLRYMLDENEFLSSYGLRSVSRVHRDKPYVFVAGHEQHRVDYVPGEGTSYLFGGNSNWRGPIWFPINYLIIEALERYHHFYGDKLKVECPVGSGKMLTLQDVAQELSGRLSSIFLPDENGERTCHGNVKKYSSDPYWRDLVLFHEYFHGESGRGLGASHQTGWTALAVRLLENAVENPDRIEHTSQADGGEASNIRNATGARRGQPASRAALYGLKSSTSIDERPLGFAFIAIQRLSKRGSEIIAVKNSEPQEVIATLRIAMVWGKPSDQVLGISLRFGPV